MATDLEPKASPKHEAFVEQQLARMRGRIRALDAGRAVLWLAIWVLAYALAMAVFDLAVTGDDAPAVTIMRLSAFGVFLLGAAFFLGLVGLRLYRRINPYYAARQLEQTLPDAKNSVVNWLDLRDEKLPTAIRGALGLKAARDLKQADPEEAATSKNNWLLAGITVGLLFGLIVIFFMGPNQFLSLLSRAFAPFKDVSLATRTEITLLQPAQGNVTIPLNQRVDFRVQLDGRVPRRDQEDAPRLLYKYTQADPFVSVPLEEDFNGNWVTSLHADRVQNGFWYQIAAGDAQTPEYQVQVRPLPQVERFDITYHYRPYIKVKPITVRFPNEQAVFPRIGGHRGTEVVVEVFSKHALRDGRIELDHDGVRRVLDGEIPADNPHAFRCKWVLDKNGIFKVLFTTQAGEENTDRSPYLVEVIPDNVPNVVIAKPGKDIALPANGTLHVEGVATDDWGVKNMTLRVKVLEGDDKPALQPKEYRPGKSFQLVNGRFPDRLEYKDLLALEQLKTDAGLPFQVAAGMVLEYWLEAVDNCDYPDARGNLGKSPSYKINIQPPQDEKQQTDERQKAQKEQQQHEKKQDQDIDKRNESAKQQDPETQKKDLEKKANDLKDQADRLQEQLEKKKKEDEKPGQGKGEPDKAESKPGPKKADQQPESKAKDQAPEKAQPKEQLGEKKDQPKQDQTAGEAKDNGQPPKDSPDNQSQAKGPGKEPPPPATAKNEQPKSKEDAQEKPAQAKDQGEKGLKEAPAQAKDKGPDMTQPQPSQAKDEGKPQPQEASEAKGGEEQVAKATPKDAGKKENPPTKDDVQAKGKGVADPKDAAKTAPKDTAPDTANDAGHAKSERPKSSDPSADREPTVEDINRLKDKLAKDPKLAEDIRKKLEKVGEEAKDPKDSDAIKKLAERFKDKMKDQEFKKALEELAKTLGESKKSGPEDPQTAKDGPKNKQPANGQDNNPGKGQAKKGEKPGIPGPGGKGISDPDLKAKDDGSAFAKNLGNLQLDQLQKLITPDMIKKAGMTEKEYQDFLKDAAAYQQMLKNLQAQSLDKKAEKPGLTSILPSVSPFQVKPGVPSTDPVNVNQPQPPPEFRPAQTIFTRPKN